MAFARLMLYIGTGNTLGSGAMKSLKVLDLQGNGMMSVGVSTSDGMHSCLLRYQGMVCMPTRWTLLTDIYDGPSH